MNSGLAACLALLLVALLRVPPLAAAAAAPSQAQQQDPSPLHATATTNPALLQDDASAADCPPWFLEYESFHAQQRGKPTARYLVHQASNVGLSGSLGDRLRGMLFTLRAAHALQRVVLFTWLHPFPATEFFQPAAAINWTTQGIAFHNASSRQHVFNHLQGVPFNSSALASLDNTSVITFVTNKRMDAPCDGCPELQRWSRGAACVWRRLFRPTDTIKERAQQQLVQLFNVTDPRYTAIHLRMGGLTSGSGPQVIRKSEQHLPQSHQEMRTGRATPFDNFVAAGRCARKLQQQQRHNKPGSGSADSLDAAARLPVLLLTDNHKLREFVQEGGLPGFVSPASLPVHLHLAGKQNLAAHQETVVELVMLARAACLVRSPSGFSHHAWLLGGARPCSRDFTRCKD